MSPTSEDFTQNAMLPTKNSDSMEKTMSVVGGSFSTVVVLAGELGIVNALVLLEEFRGFPLFSQKSY